MTRAREQLISPNDSPYVHTISRVVRRSFLCGLDPLTGNNYEHRRPWFIERLHDLDSAFSIDICAYAILSNHAHLVLRIDSQTAQEWRPEEVVERWGKLFSIPPLIQEFFDNNQTGSNAIREAVDNTIELWRRRLFDISWFMRCLNEHIARRANAEDHCTGRFWEGRFKSQTLLDEGAVLTCMSYVDLNPIRAAMADTPESSDFTAIQQRIQEYRTAAPKHTTQTEETETFRPALMPLVKHHQDPHPNTLGISTEEYLELVDWAGRHIVEGKRGYIPEEAPPILQRLNLDPEGYLKQIRGRDKSPHPNVLGTIDHIREAAKQAGVKFFKGLGEAQRLYLTPT